MSTAPLHTDDQQAYVARWQYRSLVTPLAYFAAPAVFVLLVWPLSTAFRSSPPC